MRELPDWFEVDRWVPPPGSIENRRVWQLMQKLGFDDYYKFLRFSTENTEDFYKAAMEDLNLEWPVAWDQLQDSSNGTEWTNWFINGRTNLTWLAIERWRDSDIADKPALHWEGEDRQKREYTHRQLAEEVDQLTAGLRSIGVKDGDVVGMYLPSVPETVTALFAVARMGAVLAPAFSGYGADALAERLKLVGAKYLITADGYLRRGKIVDMKSVADAAVDASDVTCTIVISRDDVTPSRRNGDVEWSHLLEQGIDRDYEMFAAEKPWLIAFTSGSTVRSLAIIKSLPDAVLLPGHGPVAPSTHARVDQLFDHHAERLDLIEKAVAAGLVNAFAIGGALKWTRREHKLEDLDPFNAMLAVLEVSAHLEVLVTQGRVKESIAEGQSTYTAS